MLTRRAFFKAAAGGAAAVAVYSGEIARHWIETTQHEVRLEGLAPEFDGFRVVQIGDIHIDLFTEPYFLREAVDRINRLKPDAVFLAGDFVTRPKGIHKLHLQKFVEGTAWQCAKILAKLACRERYAVFGNHDVLVGKDVVGTALEENGVTVLCNDHRPLERGKGRIWLAGLDDPVEGQPDAAQAIPESIRNRQNEPVILLCHGPDYAHELNKRPVGQAVSLMISGHTHGGQVRIPFLPLFQLPPMGKRYVAGWFRVGNMQLYVNRGLGTVELPFRLNCPPEITAFTLRA